MEEIFELMAEEKKDDSAQRKNLEEIFELMAEEKKDDSAQRKKFGKNF